MKQQKVFMKNTYKLIWAEEALEGLKEIFSYLENNFPQKDVKSLHKNLINTLK